jgi:hypothetical protein
MPDKGNTDYMISGNAEFFPWQGRPRKYISVSLRKAD